LGDLRATVASLGEEITGLRTEQADSQRQLAELKEQTTAQAARTSALAEELRRGAAALAVVNRALTSLLEQSDRHQQALAAAWREQQDQLHSALENLEARTRQTRQLVQDLESADASRRQQLEQQLQHFGDSLEGTGTAVSRGLEAVTSRVSRLERLEQDAKNHLDPAVHRLQQQLQTLTQALAGIEAATANVLRQNDRVAAAQKAAESRVAHARARRLNNLGLRCLASHDPDSAAGCFEEACQLAPDHPQPRFNLALACFQQGDYPRAAATLNALPPDIHRQPETQFLHALIELASGNPEAARQSLARIRGTLADAPALQSAAGLASLLSHDTPGAVAAFHRAIRTAMPASPPPTLLEALAPRVQPPANPQQGAPPTR